MTQFVMPEKIQNKGFEFNIGWNDYINQDLSYGINFIGSFNKNEVINMGTDSQVINSGATNQNINHLQEPSQAILSVASG